MAKIPAKDTTISIGGVALEDDIDNWSLTVTPEKPVVTALSDVGPRRVSGNYDYGLDISGAADFAAGQSDATLYAMLDASGAMAVDPTGASAGANDPNYDAAAVELGSYRLSGGVGGRVEFAASLVGNSALARAVA